MLSRFRINKSTTQQASTSPTSNRPHTPDPATDEVKKGWNGTNLRSFDDVFDFAFSFVFFLEKKGVKRLK
jgi:hypothetical protein